jgi:hypothetical protein
VIDQATIRMGIDVEYPPEQQQALCKAKRFEYLTIAYLISAVTALYLTLMLQKIQAVRACLISSKRSRTIVLSPTSSVALP